MIQLVPNANKIAESILHRNNVVSVKKSLDFHAKNGHQTEFASHLQIYITKIGLILEECTAPQYKMRAHTYLGSIDFICKKILKMPALYNVMEAIEVNSQGNTVKHQIKDVKINIDFTINTYNNLISEIIKATKLNAFKACYLNKHSSKRDVPVIDEERHHKYFMVGKTKFQLKLNERYEIDPYAKSISTKITLYWPDGTPNKYASIYIKCKTTNRILSSFEHIDISHPNSKKAIHFTCRESDLDRRVLYLSVIVKVEKKEQVLTHTTGALWWKQEHYEDVFTPVFTREEQISQFFKPQ